MVYYYDKWYLFCMVDEYYYYEVGNQCVVFEWCGWWILLLVCYDLCFLVWLCNQNDYDLVLYVVNWLVLCLLYWQLLLIVCVIENQVYVVGCNWVGIDGNGYYYCGDSWIINFQGEIIVIVDLYQVICFDVELLLSVFQEYCEKFFVWCDVDFFMIG